MNEKFQRNTKKVTKVKHQARRPTTKSGMPIGAMDRYVTVTKPNMSARNPQGSETSKRQYKVGILYLILPKKLRKRLVKEEEG